MTRQTNEKTKARLFYLDNLRIYLTILVIVHHSALAYVGAGHWPISDPMVDEISPIFLSFFTAINQSYFMSLYFLLAGYFTPGSFDKKGAGNFLRDRLVRLGIPILIYTTIIHNFNIYIYQVFYLKIPISLTLEYSPDHLWFLQALLIFTLVYVVFRVIADRDPTRKWMHCYQDRFPSNTALVLSILILTILTFLVRLKFPVGVWTFHMSLAHFVHYGFSFFVGILAQRGNWFKRLTKKQARRWGIVSLVVMPLLIVLVIAGGLLENEANIVKTFGGLHWQAFGYVLWETILFIGISVFLLYFFRERFNSAGRLLRWMAVNVYTVYIIRLTFLWVMNIALLTVKIPTILKFFIVSLVTIPVSFVLSATIRKFPYARWVLG